MASITNVTDFPKIEQSLIVLLYLFEIFLQTGHSHSLDKLFKYIIIELFKYSISVMLKLSAKKIKIHNITIIISKILMILYHKLIRFTKSEG